jgi:hypothetical protein
MSIGLRQFHATLLVRLRSDELRRDICCGRKKLPFAEYSIVKDQLGGIAPNPQLVARSPLTAHAEANLFTSACRLARCSRSAQQSGPTSVGARPKSLTRAPKLFFKNQPDTAKVGLPTVARSPLAVGPPSRFALPVGNLRVHSRAEVGGEYRARTGDLLVANQALSQLS